MATTGPNLGLTIADTPGVTPWYTWFETNLGMLDALIHLTVIARDETTPPSSPSNGDRYHIGASATWAWSGQDGKIAIRRGGAWVFNALKEGFLLTSVADPGKLYKYES